MKKSILALLVVLLTLSAHGQPQKIKCRVTGKTMDECCCETKDGKPYCKLTKKTYDKCCCEGM